MNGIHWEGDIAFLMQGSKTQTAFDFEVPCPFTPSKVPCSHRIDLRQELDPDILERFPADDPLVKAMSPVPKHLSDKVSFVVFDDYQILIATLARMSSPVSLPIAPFWSMRPDKIIRELQSTNVQPLVLTGVQTTHRGPLDLVLQAAPFLPRRLVLQGERGVILRPEAVKITTTIATTNVSDFIALPWEAYGSHLLRHHMLKKDP